MWVEQWVACAKQLTQWDTLLEYARQTDNTSLTMDALWRVGDFDNLKTALGSGKVGARPGGGGGRWRGGDTPMTALGSGTVGARRAPGGGGGRKGPARFAGWGGPNDFDRL